ncbi:MAG: SRPBCC family protein [Actinomycetota bacterium]|nr:SRPBCC family protein [Actinomycetota bacterium]
MDAVSVSTVISKPREEVFEYLADIANHAEFTDHYLTDWHLTRERSYGMGAGARFRIKAPFARFAWADMTLAEVDPPFRIVEQGRGGKYNRVRLLGTYTLSDGPDETTNVEYRFETRPVQPSDRLMEVLGGRAWTRRQAAKGMRRLRAILEGNGTPGPRPSISGR